MYVTWARAALFTSVLATNLDQSDVGRELLNVGAQVDLRMVIFSGLPSTLSFGAATAFEQHRETSTEFMISLRILG